MITEQQLIEAALRVQSEAYAPYSDYPVGAAVDANGKLHVGCNVENKSYGLTICAERSAIAAAVAAGNREIAAVAIAGRDQPSPCGACRQVIFELGPKATILLVDSNQPDRIVRRTISELLPHAF